MAARASSETMPETISSKGFVTAMTPSRPPSSLTASPMTEATGSASTLSPSGATTTSCALVPLAWGNVRSSSARPSCASVPGMEKELSVPFMKSAAPPPASASSSSHDTSTRHE